MSLRLFFKNPIIVYFFFFFFAYFWSLKIYFEFGADYGQYLAGSIFIDKDYRLYVDHFDNKGPFYYFFLKLVYSIFQSSYENINLGLTFSLLIYFFPIIYLINRIFRNDQKYLKFFLYCILCASVFEQNTNASIFFFFNGLIFTSFIFLYLSLKNNSILNYILGVTFFSLALYTIIIAVFFLPVILYVFFIFFKKKQKVINKLLLILSVSLIPIIILLVMKISFDFTFYDFFENNILFNFFYNIEFYGQFTSFVININRKGHFIYLTSTVLIFFFLKIVYKYFINNFFKNLRSFNLEKILSKKNEIKNFALLIFLCGFICELAFNSDKSYYILVLSGSILFSTIILFERNFYLRIYKFLFPILIYSLVLITGPIFSKLLFNFDCIKNINCNRNFEFGFQEIITENMIQNDDEKFTVIGGSRGWPHIFLNKKPAGSLINSFLYSGSFFYENEAFIKLHNKIISKNLEYIILENRILDQKIKNKYLTEIINLKKDIFRYKKFSKITY